MQYTRLGSTGTTVSRICLGMMTYGDPQWRPWILGEDAARPVVRRAWEAGVTFYDTADMYSLGASEVVTGNLLRELAAPRDEVVVATKVHHAMGPGHNQRGLSRKHIFDAIDASLRRLKMDYVDLYQIHRWDPATPIEETMDALNDIVRAGKVRYIGASSMFAWQFCQAIYTARLHGGAPFMCMQNHYNLLYREEEREMLPLCAALGIGVLPWSPLARGWLSGSRVRGADPATPRAAADPYADALYGTDADWQIVDATRTVAEQLGRTPSQVALAWLLAQPTVTSPIIGASKLHHLDEAISALDIALDADQRAALEAPYAPRAIAGHS